MTKEQVILQRKATALNEIRWIYNPHNYNKGKGLDSNSYDESWAEQRDYLVKQIIINLEADLIGLKKK